MGIEGRDKVKALEAGALAVSGQLGKTVQRLRKTYNLSLSELSEQSGVAKSIISQIERNETNPTLSTIWRLAQAPDVSIERVLQVSEDEPFLEKSSKGDTPITTSSVVPAGSRFRQRLAISSPNRSTAAASSTTLPFRPRAASRGTSFRPTTRASVSPNRGSGRRKTSSHLASLPTAAAPQAFTSIAGTAQALPSPATSPSEDRPA